MYILGIGANGHLAMNEPHDILTTSCHISKLSEQTRAHSMIDSIQKMPRFGISLGMADLFFSKKILLLLSGAHKKEIFQILLKKEISTCVPASFLWLYPNVTLLVDRIAAGVNLKNSS